MNTIYRLSLVLVATSMACTGETADADDVASTEAALRAGSDETIDIGCMDLQDPNANTRYLHAGGTDTYVFRICETPPYPRNRVGFHIYPAGKSWTLTMTDPAGNTYTKDSKYSGDLSWYAVAPAVVGEYRAVITSRGNQSYVVGSLVDTFPAL